MREIAQFFDAMFSTLIKRTTDSKSAQLHAA